MINPTDENDDELLSAYVDGELTADERALVERRLRTDPQAAQLVEELRSLSTAIKSLPRETLGRDLRASIQAELDEALPGERRQVLPLSEPLDSPRGFRRGFLWSSIAIAAALLLMFVEAQDQEVPRDVAAVAKDEPGRVGGGARGQDAMQDGKLPPMGEMRAAAPAPAPAEKPSGAVADGQIMAPTEATEPEPAAPASAEALDAAGSAVADAETSPLDPDRWRYMREQSELEAKTADALAAERELAALQDQPPPGPAVTSAPASDPAPAPSDAPAAGAPIASRSGSSEAPAVATVEIELLTDDGISRFTRLLALHDIQPPATLGGSDAAKRANEFDAQERAVELGSDLHYLGDSKELAERNRTTPIEVMVEGSPEQVERLLVSCQQAPDAFAQVNAPEELQRRSALRRQAAPTSGGFGGAAAGEALALDARGEERATRDAQNAPGDDDAEADTLALGRAWILPTLQPEQERKLYAYGIHGGKESQHQLGEPEIKGQAAAEAGQGQSPPAEGAARRPDPEQLAKQLAAPPQPGQVRVKFVLRQASPPPVAAPAEAQP